MVLAQQNFLSLEPPLHLPSITLFSWNTCWCCDRRSIWPWPNRPLPVSKPFSVWLLPNFHRVPVDAVTDVQYDSGPMTSPNVETLLHLAFTQFSWNTCWCCDRHSIWLAQQTSPSVETLLHLFFLNFKSMKYLLMLWQTRGMILARVKRSFQSGGWSLDSPAT